MEGTNFRCWRARRPDPRDLALQNPRAHKRRPPSPGGTECLESSWLCSLLSWPDSGVYVKLPIRSRSRGLAARPADVPAKRTRWKSDVPPSRCNNMSSTRPLPYSLVVCSLEYHSMACGVALGSCWPEATPALLWWGVPGLANLNVRPDVISNSDTRAPSL